MLAQDICALLPHSTDVSFPHVVRPINWEGLGESRGPPQAPPAHIQLCNELADCTAKDVRYFRSTFRTAIVGMRAMIGAILTWRVIGWFVCHGISPLVANICT
jgi:hypothetical protein